MERNRKEVDKGKSKVLSPSSLNIHSQATRPSMKREKDGSSSSKDGGMGCGEETNRNRYCNKWISIHLSLTIDSEPSDMIRCGKFDIVLELSPRNASKAKYESGKQEEEPSVQTRFRVYEICEICCERKEKFDMFRNEGCIHSICTDCISKHIQVKVERNSSSILCPGLDCSVELAPERCKEFLPEIVAEMWKKTIIEAMILDSEKLYCPFKDCSAKLLIDGADKMKESECPHCRRLFCLHCRVPWHSGMECREFKKLNADEIGREGTQLKKLAMKKKGKKRIPQKTDGCEYMPYRPWLARC